MAQANGKNGLTGRVRLRGDKSLSHRAVIFSSLAKGKSRIRNLSAGLDVASSLSVYSQLGVRFENSGNDLIVTSPGVMGFTADPGRLDCGNSGTTLRLTTGALAGSGVACELTGDESLSRRPVMRVIRPLRLMGADLSTNEDCDNPPVLLRGAKLKGIEYRSPVASAQVKSAILLAALSAEGDTVFSEPAPSRDHTERLLRCHGIEIATSEGKILLSPGKPLIPFDYDIPGDISTAVNLVVAALVTHGSHICVEGVLVNETRVGALNVLNEMGAHSVAENFLEIAGEPVADLIAQSSGLSAIDTTPYPAAGFIDEIPILAVAAAFAAGPTVFRDVGELRVKESNRLKGIIDILAAYGCRAYSDGDDLVVEGGVTARKSMPNHLGDHRLAMAIEVLNLATGGELGDEYQEIVSISAPEFYGCLRRLVNGG